MFALASFSPLSARAETDQAKQCAAAAERGQELERSRRFRDAEARFRECASSECPADIASDCRGWAARMEGQLATMLFLAIGPDGRPVQDAIVTVDGVVLAERLDGKPVTLEAGPHRVRIAQGRSVVEESIVLQPGERGRVMLAKLPAVAAKEPQTHRPIPVSVYAFGGVGLLGLAGFTILAVKGTNEVDRLRSDCGPTCPEADLDSARTTILAADISLAIGIASLATSATLFLIRPRVPLAPASGLTVSTMTSRSGGMAVIGGSF